MKFILEYKSFYNVDDIVLIEYWYNDIVTPVKILEKNRGHYKVTHNIPQSKIKNTFRRQPVNLTQAERDNANHR